MSTKKTLQKWCGRFRWPRLAVTYLKGTLHSNVISRRDDLSIGGCQLIFSNRLTSCFFDSVSRCKATKKLDNL